MLEVNKAYIRENISKFRQDGRKPKELRDVKIETGVIEKAEGSARVKFGNTDVIVGVKLDVGEPFPDTPDQGVLMTGAEKSALASPEFENGPPKEDAIELARVVDRAIRESKSIDFGKLCITKGEKVWMVFVDISIVNNDGNLFDASCLGALAALLTANIPAIKEDGTVDHNASPTGKVPMRDKPIMVTSSIINGTMLIDPTATEEEVVDGSLNIAAKEDGSVCAMQKSGSCEFTEEQILEAIDDSLSFGKKIRAILNKEIKG